MKKVNLKDKLKNFRRIGLTAITSFAACLIFGANAYPVVASAEEATPANTVTIDITVKETQDVYSIELTKENNGEYVVSCEGDESFVYTVSETDGVTTVACSGLKDEGEWTYEMTYVVENENSFSVTKGADAVEVKIIIPDTALVDEFKDTLKIADNILIPKIYLGVAGILFVILVIFGFAMLCVAL